MGSCCSKTTTVDYSDVKDLSDCFTSGVSISTADVRSKLKAYFGTDNVQIADAKYAMPSLTAVKNFLANDPTDSAKYGSEIRDCDDFAQILLSRAHEAVALKDSLSGRAITFGFVSGDLRSASAPDTPRGHAVNFVITAENGGTVHMIEPQNDNLFDLVKNSKVSLVYI